jgi:hypothetical protein
MNRNWGVLRQKRKEENENQHDSGALLQVNLLPCSVMDPRAVLKLVNHQPRLFLVKRKPIATDLAELNRTETRLLEAINDARFQYECGKYGPEEYDAALRRFNQFAIDKPLCEGGPEDSCLRSPQLFCIRRRAMFPQNE